MEKEISDPKNSKSMRRPQGDGAPTFSNEEALRLHQEAGEIERLHFAHC
ncbi:MULTISPECIES: hypothetical protein [Variovorax]|nr:MULTISPECIES: hypothetical protein [Variovorax]MBN8755733.1 hypothetical protein [Variovorax sp.]UKI07269.1 hypothetical protein L3V85_31440 [Variovorax paradoxus]